MAARASRSALRERLKHVLWAAAISLVLMLSTMLEPIDQLTWVTQSRAVDRAASGDIVFVSSDEDIADSASPVRREELTNTLQSLRRAGVSKVFIDTVFSRPSDPVVDARLNREMRAWGPNLSLVNRYTDRLTGRETVARSTPAIAHGVPTIDGRRTISSFGLVWTIESSPAQAQDETSSLAAAMAGTGPEADQRLLFYGFNLDTIPELKMGQVPVMAQHDLGSLRADISGKTVIIGSTNFRADPPFQIPGRFDVPGPIIHILSAETLKAGLGKEVRPYWLWTFALLLIGASACLRLHRARRRAYAATIGLLVTAVVVTTVLEYYVSISAALTLLFCYGAMRIRSHWQQSVRLVDDASGLPTFAALDSDPTVAATSPAIIVARIHRFEEVRRTLPIDLHREYLTKIVDRLRAARPDEKIYAGPGHLIAWTMGEKDAQLIRDHLNGLRALFSAPLQVGDTQVDVGITFGVDMGSGSDVPRRVATAVSAAEATNETYDPINIAENNREEDLLWNISLQSRIDAALENGEIYLIFQPKILLATHEMVGVEALVRWNDPQRGLIPPDDFIKQCEHAGRMSHLTRHVLREACVTGNDLCDRGMQIPVAVNISATLLHESAIVDMVRSVLEETGFEPRHLTLEVTETYRLSNMERAAENLTALKALGCKIAMDDFGVGAASLEALMCLPFDELKIDRLFTSAILENEKAAAIVRHVLKLGRDMNVVVVAEGVEDEETLNALRREGCLVVQGFALARPMDAAGLIASDWFRPVETLRKMV